MMLSVRTRVETKQVFHDANHPSLAHKLSEIWDAAYLGSSKIETPTISVAGINLCHYWLGVPCVLYTTHYSRWPGE